MLVLFETPAGYALFKVLDEKKVAAATDADFSSLDRTSKLLKLKAFDKFTDTTAALAAATALVEATVDKPLKKFLKKNILESKDGKDKAEMLAVCDAKLGASIKDALGISCVHDASVLELMRGIRQHIDALVGVDNTSVLPTMALGLAHSLSRYKLKFSPDKIDTMVVQAVGLLDDIDKELNKYGMRVKEWYGWHFPELQKLIADPVLYSRTVLLMGNRSNAASAPLEQVLDEATAQGVKDAALISMGTEVSEVDLMNIRALATEVVSMHTYRAELYDYLKARMQAIAPNLTCMVGEIVGARLIAHAGSLLALAKHPASTVQILGAEKALFRALKAKKDTPKYGLIYHASVVGQANTRNKGKISRVLANKTALSVRVDALGDKETATIGQEDRQRVEARLGALEGRAVQQLSGRGRVQHQSASKYEQSKTKSYNEGADVVMKTPKEEKPSKKIEETPVFPSSAAKEEKSEKKEKKEKSKDKEEKSEKKEKKEKSKDKEEKEEKKSKKRDRDDSDDEEKREKKKSKKEKKEKE